MLGYQTINLLDVLAKDGDELTKENLRQFYCPYNGDVEDFLHNKAITFAKQGLSSVWLVFASFKDDWRLAGYFALANKFLNISTKKLSSNLRRKITKFASFDGDLKRYNLAAPLIGQLGKNYRDNCNELISGDELLAIACNKIKEGQRILGGRVTFVECEDVPALINFYERNQFKIFDRREPTREEKETFRDRHLIQLIKYLS